MFATQTAMFKCDDGLDSHEDRHLAICTIENEQITRTSIRLKIPPRTSSDNYFGAIHISSGRDEFKL
jgi:hypothetical protein